MTTPRIVGVAVTLLFLIYGMVNRPNEIVYVVFVAVLYGAIAWGIANGIRYLVMRAKRS